MVNEIPEIHYALSMVSGNPISILMYFTLIPIVLLLKKYSIIKTTITIIIIRVLKKSYSINI